MDGRAPCGILLSVGERGGIRESVGEMWEREREHHGERFGDGLRFSLCVQ